MAANIKFPDLGKLMGKISPAAKTWPDFSLILAGAEEEKTIYSHRPAGQGANGPAPCLDFFRAAYMETDEDQVIACPDNLKNRKIFQNEDQVIACPDKCCRALLIAKNTFLVFSCGQRLSLPAGQMAAMLLYLLAREAEHQSQLTRLRNEVEFGEMIIHSISSGFLVLAPDLTITKANPAACSLLNAGMEKVLGAKLDEFIMSKLIVRDIFTSGEAIIDREVTIKLAHKDMRIIKTAVPVFDRDGSIIAVLDHFREIKEAHKLATRLTGAKASFTFSDIIYQSQAMGDAIAIAKMAAGNSLSVLITGESGTGKELFAHAIHMAGPRCHAPFIVIDCASLPRDLVASELFGYVEGAFTGARKNGMPGKFELADGGTLFLDELGELPLEIQPQFLRVLQNREVMRLGGKDVTPVNIRIIAATNRDLSQEVKNGYFREDLFYRLNVLGIHIPSLRSRPEDIMPLAEYFSKKYCSIIGKPKLAFSGEATAILRGRAWPGNVRELENIIAKAVHMAENRIGEEQVSEAAQSALKSWPGAAGSPAAAEGSMKDWEATMIKQTIAACSGNISMAARRLGLARSTIYKKMLTWQPYDIREN